MNSNDNIHAVVCVCNEFVSGFLAFAHVVFFSLYNVFDNVWKSEVRI